MTISAAPERVWQEQVIELAHILGWRHLHVRRSIGKGNAWVTATNVKGWPDLVLWSERQQRVLYVELKKEGGRLTLEQREVLASLAAAGCETWVWRPSDLDDVQRILGAVS